MLEFKSCEKTCSKNGCKKGAMKSKKRRGEPKWAMGLNKYRPALRSERWEQGRTVGQRFVSHRDRPRDRVKTDGQDMYRQRKRFKTGGHGMETDRQTDRGRRFLWRRLMGVCNARSHWHWCRQNCAEVGSTLVRECKEGR